MNILRTSALGGSDPARYHPKGLSAQGIEFIEENGGGPGVRLRKPTKQKR
jgi:hypothetical protein